MVGEGVLHECLNHKEVEQVLVLGRKSCGYTHPKLKEIVHANLYDLSSIESQLSNYNACYFCLGTTSIGKNEEEYTKISYTLTMHTASTLSKLNKDMTFCYVSGAGTSDTKKTMWSRVKSRTENDLIKLPFKQVFNFRPGYMQPTPGLKNSLSAYKYVGWLYPLFRLTMPGFVTTLKEVGLAMINATLHGYKINFIEVKDIISLSKK